MSDISGLASRGMAGRQLAQALARGLYWRVREALQSRRVRAALTYGSTIVRLRAFASGLNVLFSRASQNACVLLLPARFCSRREISRLCGIAPGRLWFCRLADGLAGAKMAQP